MEPGGLQSTGLQRVRHDRVTKHMACGNLSSPDHGSDLCLLPAPALQVDSLPAEPSGKPQCTTDA